MKEEPKSKKRLTISMDEETYRELRIRAAQENTSMSKLVNEMINLYIILYKVSK